MRKRSGWSVLLFSVIFGCAFAAAFGIFFVWNWEKGNAVCSYESFAPADDLIHFSIDEIAEANGAEAYYISGWICDEKLYYGYNLGIDASYVSVLGNTAFALTDGETVILLRGKRFSRTDAEALFPLPRPEGSVPVRLGIKAVVTREELKRLKGERGDLAAVSMRRDAPPVMALARESVALK
ncbi:MAG: hypothetical protein K6E30_04760 [Lachnospiraceae bacterium]|nr:hypothetical protein [Lachnospiraceae bacterium]